MNRRNVRLGKGEIGVLHLCSAMEQIAPTWSAADWDNVGLLIGNPQWTMRRVLLTIDLTSWVLNEARARKVDTIISYHPPVFKASKSLVVNQWTQQGIAADTLAQGIAVYSPHTALDASPGGTNDVLADLCGLEDCRPFAPCADPLPQCKIVVFVPKESVDRVAKAAFENGAGWIGDYKNCSFRSQGQGTFFGMDSTKPRVGKRGRLETVEEVRLEFIIEERLLEQEVIEDIRKAHPYEEPVIDIYPLRPSMKLGFGQGRIGTLRKEMRVADLARLLKEKTGARNVTHISGETPRLNLKNWRVKNVAICVGAAGELPLRFAWSGAAVITGEIRHHDALEYQRRGVCAIALGHWASERPVLKPLAARLRKALPSVEFLVSRADRDPYVAI